MDPWEVLKKHHAFLKKGGNIICSIPNIRHYRIIKKLLFKGRWEYTGDGIMDRDHLRFFTLIRFGECSRRQVLRLKM
jgi:tRNA A58 N-methylase Trm61